MYKPDHPQPPVIITSYRSSSTSSPFPRLRGRSIQRAEHRIGQAQVPEQRPAVLTGHKFSRIILHAPVFDDGAHLGKAFLA